MFFTSWVQHQLLKTVVKVLAFPAAAPYKSAQWLLGEIHGEVEAEQLDEDRVMEQLMELQLLYEMEEIEKEDFEAQEKELMERLNAIRERKKDEEFEPEERWWRRTFPEAEE